MAARGAWLAAAMLATTGGMRIGPLRFGAPATADPSRDLDLIHPAVVDASHNIVGYEATCAADGDDQSFWLVPGGQRMEMMSYALASSAERRPLITPCLLALARPTCARLPLASRKDKWLVLDLGCESVVRAMSLLGEVNSFAPARVLLDAAPTADGPWRRVSHFRGLGALRWQRIDLGESRPASRYFRLYIRREGHAKRGV